MLDDLPQLQRNFPKRELYQPYVTWGATCQACGKLHHTRDQCFRLHGYPKEFQRYVVPQGNSGGGTQRPAGLRAAGQGTFQPSDRRVEAISPTHLNDRFQKLEGVMSAMMAQMERL